ncbi:hypothetical protein DPMN_062050 [Dreissena polymorpha]|uniref:ABC transmembrane type-1 domain-containing protein n=1 Tax=Dreissena polymorpha TaxID=45954 RepID=A0A9D4C922_DREPO|nr:hypothetical protein DPMN_062050 [Dreissena polymorpha]
MFFAYAAAFWLGAYLIKQSEVDYVDVFKAFSAILFGGMAVGNASAFAPDAAKAEQSAKEIFQLIDKKPDIDNESETGKKTRYIHSQSELLEYHILLPHPP